MAARQPGFWLQSKHMVPAARLRQSASTLHVREPNAGWLLRRQLAASLPMRSGFVH